MTTEEKAKAYDEALKEAKKWHKTFVSGQNYPATDIKVSYEWIFPELKESEDERIRKTIIRFFKDNYPNEIEMYDETVTVSKALAWLEKQGDKDKLIKELGEYKVKYTQEVLSQYLEKQGKQKEYTFKSIPRLLDMIEPSDRAKAYCQKLIGALVREGYAADAKIVEECLKKMNGEDVPMAVMDEKQGEQKPVIKMKTPEESLGIDSETYNEIVNDCIFGENEPKFKVGDWITNGEYTWKVIAIQPLDYILQSQDGNEVDDTISYVDRNFHLWTIQDAKEGDVLYCKSSGVEYIIILKQLNNRSLDSYCRYNTIDGFAIDVPRVMSIQDNPKPATKEQRETLMKAISDAGYEWNAELKKVSKITTPADVGFEELGKAWAEEAKNKKPTWSEEDDYNLQCMIAKVTSDIQKGNIGRNYELIDWLKSLKEKFKKK